LLHMLPSVEARWFIAGLLPEKLRTWFVQGMIVAADPKIRTDHYLFLPGVASIGMKLREGKFEVKRRDADFGLVPIGSRATGRLALWRKWSFTIAGKDGEEAPDGHWFSIEKKRLLRKYILKNGGFTSVDPATTFSEFGCTVELTTLKIRHVDWWSFGFEAFGPDENRLRETLEQVTTSCVDGLDDPGLSADNSFDYPEWIGSLNQLADGHP
jgi:hypothetical protein